MFYFVRNNHHGTVFTEHYREVFDAIEAAQFGKWLFGVPFRVRPRCLVSYRESFAGRAFRRTDDPIPE